VRILKSRCIESKSFRNEGVQRNPRVMWSLEDCSVFFRIHAGRRGFVLIRLGCSALAEAELDFGQSLVMCPAVPQKRQSCCQDSADIPVELAFHLSQVSKKGWSGCSSSV